MTDKLADALKAVLETPEATKNLAYLHKGIGTKTDMRVWLDAEQALTAHEAAIRQPQGVPILEAMPTQAVYLIKRMAAQKLFEEMDGDMLDEDGELNGCWQEGYESMVRMSREALALLNEQGA